MGRLTLEPSAFEHPDARDELFWGARGGAIGANFWFALTLRACESFDRMALHTDLTLRNGAKRSVSKGGDAKDVARAASVSASARCVLPPFETPRFATLLRVRIPLQHQQR